jgi:hypothetical protein
MVAGHRVDDRAVNDLLGRVVLVIAHNASFDRCVLERRLPAFATKHWACSRSDFDWKAEGFRSSALESVAYSLGFFHDGHRAGSDCRATVHMLAQRLPGTGRLALQALLERARQPTWRSWARDAAIEKKDILKARGYAWSPGKFARPKCWYRNVSDADKATEVSLAPNECDGVGSSRMGLADHRERSVFRSMLGMGRTVGRTSGAEFGCRFSPARRVGLTGPPDCVRRCYRWIWPRRQDCRCRGVVRNALLAHPEPAEAAS